MADDPTDYREEARREQQELLARRGIYAEPDVFVCNKCGYGGGTSEHDGCNYLAVFAPAATSAPREGVVYVPVAESLMENLEADWSPPVQVKIERREGNEIQFVARHAPLGERADLEIKTLRSIISRLCCENQDMRKDAERMDWLELAHRDVYAILADDPFGEPTRELWEVEGSGLENIRPTLREAVDASIAKGHIHGPEDNG